MVEMDAQTVLDYRYGIILRNDNGGLAMMKLILFIILCVFGVAAYQVAVEEGYFDSGPAPGDYASEAEPRPPSPPPTSGEPDVGPYTPPSINCNDLATLKRNKDNAYHTFLSNQSKANYENYTYHERRYTDAIRQCYPR